VTYRYYINYQELLDKYKLFQHIPHSFRDIRNNIGGLLDWLDSDDAAKLPTEDNLSQSYWKRCPANWLVLPPQIQRNIVSMETTFVAPLQQIAPPSPPTDESISRSLSSTSLHDDDLEVTTGEQFDDYMDAKKRAHQNDFIPFIVPPRIKLLREDSRLRNTVTASD
jgi:hypothetical protein